jgi:branched-chain amino acid aminotransferase
MEIKIVRTEKPKPKPRDSELSFGKQFADHMFNMDYTREHGWRNARIEPYGPIMMDPATMVLHYGQAIFEGLKAYRTTTRSIRLFRPMDNLVRLNASARMLCIPEIDTEFAFSVLQELLAIDKEWIPGLPGTSLYIRPTIVAMDPYLGVRPSHTYRFFIILCPVGAYYPEGFNPVKIWVTDKYVRAVRGGVGMAKTAGNYGASLRAAEEAKEKGYTQVLWLDGVKRKYIEEVGTMNIFFAIGDTLITPVLQGSILAGITRDSVIKIAKDWGIPVEERPITIDEVMAAHDNGMLQEIFGSGTAAVISPVSELAWKDRVIRIKDGAVGPLAKRLHDEITAIQYGEAEDRFGWVVSSDRL